MREYAPVLERVERRVRMPEPAMERLLRRRQTRVRNQRIAAGAVGLVVAFVGIGFGFLALRGREPGSPASGATPGPERGGQGIVEIVLPTVAIWVALAVLGLTGLAIVRLRRGRGETSANGSTTGARSAQGHGPDTETGSARGNGGNEMDSKTKHDVRLKEVGIPEAPLDASRVQRVNRWLIGAVVALAVALVVVGPRAIFERSGGEQQAATPTQIGVADARTVQMIDALFAATTGEESASFFTEDGIVDVRTDEVATIEGRADIASAMQENFDQGWYAYRLGSVAQWGNFAAHAIAGPTEASPLGKRDFHGMAIYELTPDGKIGHMWIFGDYRL